MSKKKILLFGATGMAGHIIYTYLKNTDNYVIVPIAYRNKLTDDCILLNVTNIDDVSELIRIQKPHYIINCIGVLIKGSTNYPDNAIFLNAYFPHLLGKLGNEVGAKLIHISTDCVFSGIKGSYNEEDFKDAEDIYGKSKGLGEVISSNHLTLRTSIIGPELKQQGEGLFDWFMRQRGEIKGFTMSLWGGITTLQLAKGIHSALENDLKGLAHVTNGEKISKFDLVILFKEIWDRSQVTIKSIPGKVVDKSLQKSQKFNFNVPSYEVMLLDQKEWMDNHKSLYNKVYSNL